MTMQEVPRWHREVRISAEQAELWPFTKDAAALCRNAGQAALYYGTASAILMGIFTRAEVECGGGTLAMKRSRSQRTGSSFLSLSYSAAVAVLEAELIIFSCC